MTEPWIVRQLRKGQLKWLVKKGYEVTIVCNKNGSLKWLLKQGVNVAQVDFTREINIFNDLRCLTQLIKTLRKLKPDIIHYSTPKASFLTPLAIKLSLINSSVIYTVRGRIYENFSVVKKKIFELIEFFSCLVANKVIFISKELKKSFIKTNIVNKKKSIIIGNGSSNGFDFKIFKKPSKIQIKNSKKFFKVQHFSKVITFVGRINKDKGIDDLLYVFKELSNEHNDIGLLLVGNLEMNLDKLLKKYKINRNKIVMKKWIPDTNKAYWASDIFLFPSFREGFGNVCIESILCGVPVVAYNIVGVREAVKNDVSGLLVPFRNKKEMIFKTKILIENNALKIKLSKKGMKWAKSKFDQKTIWNGIDNIYKKINLTKV